MGVENAKGGRPLWSSGVRGLRCRSSGRLFVWFPVVRIALLRCQERSRGTAHRPAVFLSCDLAIVIVLVDACGRGAQCTIKCNFLTLVMPFEVSSRRHANRAIACTGSHLA